VQGIPGELRQVFSNLLTNSLDAIDAGGRISIRANRRSWNSVPVVRVTFADSGCGIDRGKRSEIFRSLFYDEARCGEWLGLWVASQIVEKHRGSRMRSRMERPNCGTTFCIDRPI
jgi:signal transduction histidine kinase